MKVKKNSTSTGENYKTNIGENGAVGSTTSILVYYLDLFSPVKKYILRITT